MLSLSSAQRQKTSIVKNKSYIDRTQVAALPRSSGTNTFIEKNGNLLKNLQSYFLSEKKIENKNTCTLVFQLGIE